MKRIANEVNRTFLDVFGRTPMRQRTEDILKQAIELSRFSDLLNLREKLGDTLTSCIQACNENGWPLETVISESLAKIRRRAPQYKALGRKTKVALFGGAFDPITSGHIATAQLLLNVSKSFDEVWIMPCFQHLTKKLTSPEHRLKMCRLASRKDGRIKVFDYEIKHQFRGETYNLVKRLLAEPWADQYEFAHIIGQDNANTFDTWINFEELERMIAFVVVPRKGIKPNPKATWFLHRPHIYLQPDDSIPRISSTEIRTAIREDTDRSARFLAKHLDPLVLAYITKHHLYKAPPTKIKTSKSD